MNLNNFMSYVENSCQNNGVELVSTKGDRVYYSNIACNGFFEPLMPVDMTAELLTQKNDITPSSLQTRPVLAFSMGGKTESEVLELLAHEYGHMCQYLEKSNLWLSQKDFEIFDLWLGGKDFDENILQFVWEGIVKLEADCENRVIKLVDELGLNIDKSRYCKNANAYLYFYSWARKNRQWYLTAPYQIDEIVQVMPSELSSNIEDYVSDNLLNSDLMKLFDKCLVE